MSELLNDHRQRWAVEPAVVLLPGILRDGPILASPLERAAESALGPRARGVASASRQEPLREPRSLARVLGAADLAGVDAVMAVLLAGRWPSDPFPRWAVEESPGRAGSGCAARPMVTRWASPWGRPAMGRPVAAGQLRGSSERGRSAAPDCAPPPISEFGGHPVERWELPDSRQRGTGLEQPGHGESELRHALQPSGYPAYRGSIARPPSDR
jgi:hypothetical protein